MNFNQPRVLVDTSFLGNLMFDQAEFNENALRYFFLLQQHKSRFYIPSLVAAEYSLRGNVGVVINALSARVISFGLVEAEGYAHHTNQFDWIPKKMSRAQKRDAVIDLMLISQAITHRMDIIVTADKGLCNRVPLGSKFEVFDITQPPESISPLWRQANELSVPIRVLKRSEDPQS